MKFFDETVGYVRIKNNRYPVDMKGREHNPAHVHVEIDDTSGLFEIKDGSQRRGNVKSKHSVLIKAWILANREHLIREWNKRNPSLHIDCFIRKYRISDNLCCTSDSMQCPCHPLHVHFTRHFINSVRFCDTLITRLNQKYLRSIHRAKIYRRKGMDTSKEIQLAKEIIKLIHNLKKLSN